MVTTKHLLLPRGNELSEKRNRGLNMIASETLKLTFDVDYRAIRRIWKYYAR